MTRPVLYVLAGANGAGKSSIGGFLLEQQGLTWFNPDTFARELMAATGCDQGTANGKAWAEGLRRLKEAIADGRNHAFETTLGGTTMTGTILNASPTHDVLIWFCGLSSAEQHIARVRARVAAGGHDIPEERIRGRYTRAVLNLIKILPHTAGLVVYDNSVEAGADNTVPDPVLVLQVENGQVRWPAADDLDTLARTPAWARPIVEAAFTLPRN